LARKRQMPVVERHIEAKELADFSEAFLAGTAAEVTPVSEIGPYRFTPGEISKTLMHDYADEVRRPVSVVDLSAK
jgi:branched-chain amino acid aminotransferase